MSAIDKMMKSIHENEKTLDDIPLAADIKTYYELNEDALEVMILKGRKLLSIDRNDVLHPSYYRIIKKRFEK